MNDLTDVIYGYLDHDRNLDPAELWTESDLRRLINAAEAELKRRASTVDAQ